MGAKPLHLTTYLRITLGRAGTSRVPTLSTLSGTTTLLAFSLSSVLPVLARVYLSLSPAASIALVRGVDGRRPRRFDGQFI